MSDLTDTPQPTFSRAEILRRLRATIAGPGPIVAAGSSCGIVATAAEAGGADLIVVYSTGLSRPRGLPTTVEHGSSNRVTLDMAPEILNVIADTPIVAGVEAIDPKFVRIEGLLDMFQEASYSGIINFPTVTEYEPARAAAYSVRMLASATTEKSVWSSWPASGTSSLCLCFRHPRRSPDG